MPVTREPCRKPDADIGAEQSQSLPRVAERRSSTLWGVLWLLVSLFLLLTVGGYLTLGVLTAIGQRRRDAGLLAASGAVLFFPVYWVVWYVHDTWPSTTRQANTWSPEPR